MKTIDSFLKDHNKMSVGLYKSSEIANVTTFDLRFKKPNTTYLSTAAAHTIEHLLATVLHNSKFSQNIVYFGPMGCRTGFYLITINMLFDDVKALLTDSIQNALLFEEVPGDSKIECGNYKDHDLKQAKIELGHYLRVLNG